MSDQTRVLRTRKIRIQERFSCNVCGKEFLKKYLLKAHSHVHTGQKPYACDYCDEEFLLKLNLREHMNVHSGVVAYPPD